MRAVDDAEKIYSPENYMNRGPTVIGEEYTQMQEEAFRIQKEMYNIIQNAMKLDLDEDDIRKILKDAQMPNKKIRKLLDGEFVPVNFSDARFKKKVKVLEDQARKMTKDNPDLKYYLDEDYAYPKDLLNDIKYDWKDKSLITETKEEEPGWIKKGAKKVWDRINPLKGFEGFDSLLRSEKIETPPLPPTSMPDKKLLAQSPQKINGLTRSEQALLSPSDKVIGRRT